MHTCRVASTFALLLVACLGLEGCIFVHVTAPLDNDLDRTELGSKEGRSQAQSVLGLVAWGDAGTQAAARQGGITTLRHADVEVLSILGFVYLRERTIVYGD
jgi:hypothetical protein